MSTDDSCRHELVAGVIIAEPFPTHHHDRTFRRLLRLLEKFIDGRELGEVFGEAGYVLARDPDTIRGPDLSFVSRERLTGFDDARLFSEHQTLPWKSCRPQTARGDARQGRRLPCRGGALGLGRRSQAAGRSRSTGRSSHHDDSNRTNHSTARTFFRGSSFRSRRPSSAGFK